MKIDKRTTIGKKLLEDIEFDTRMSKMWLRETKQTAAKLILDIDRENREKASECINCYYRSNIATANMPSYECGICHKTKIWHCGHTPKFCPECGKDNKICIYCGSKLYGNWES